MVLYCVYFMHEDGTVRNGNYQYYWNFNITVKIAFIYFLCSGIMAGNTIVEYFAEHERYRCGYCGSKDTNYSHGKRDLLYTLFHFWNCSHSVCCMTLLFWFVLTIIDLFIFINYTNICCSSSKLTPFCKSVLTSCGSNKSGVLSKDRLFCNLWTSDNQVIFNMKKSQTQLFYCACLFICMYLCIF